MIYNAFLVPSETPTSLRSIKRALLTYDKVLLADPSDRDIMPSNAFPWVLGIPMLGMSMGPVRPMGKSGSYDDSFGQILELCQPAVEQGTLIVQPTFDQEVASVGTIGSIPLGGYPLDPRFVFSLYRSMAADSNFLRKAVAKDGAGLLADLLNWPELSLDCIGDGIQNLPALPLLEDASLTTEQLSALTHIARARIGALIKFSGYCDAKDIVPVFETQGYGDLTAQLFNNAQRALLDVDEDRHWFKRNRVLELCHEEFLFGDKLDDLSISEVLQLRTRAWGKQAEARESLFASVYEIALDFGDKPQFEDRCHAMIQEYRKSSDELIRERRDLGTKITCDLVSLTIIAASGGGVVSLLASPLASVGATFAAGALWALNQTKDYLPALRVIRSKEGEMKRGAGFGLHNFYSRIPRRGL